MKGNKEIIGMLNGLLAGELMARDQYFIHARMYENWGYQKLFARVFHEMQDETEHADWLIKRILFLDGTPVGVPSSPLTIGKDVPEMLKNDLAVEYQVVAELKQVIARCEALGDYVTREMLEKMLDDTEEDHAHWLEQQIGLIDMIGLKNYLQSQMGGAGS
ncbi:MAG: bacterioferritin [Candidatus Accumulibacter sp.]|nr:bacterioferritin [Accumulibacter sp.]MBA4092506.1 bacterioferritin [Accumulibacter sp.]